MTSIGNLDATINLDSSGVATGAKQVQRELGKMGNSLQRAARVSETVADGQERTKRELDRARNSYLRVAAAAQPATRAQLQFENAARKTEVALRAGAISQRQAAETMAVYAQRVEASSQITARAVRGNARMGVAIQNAGYQVGDFAVQVASGQSALRAFIQQGTQMVSFFGPWGAVIGAAGAVLGALYTAFIQADTGAKQAKKGADDYRMSLASLEEWVIKVRDGEQGLAKFRQRAFEDEQKRRLAETQQRIAAQQVELDRLQRDYQNFLRERNDINQAIANTNDPQALAALGQLSKQLEKDFDKSFKSIKDNQSALVALEGQAKLTQEALALSNQALTQGQFGGKASFAQPAQQGAGPLSGAMKNASALAQRGQAQMQRQMAQRQRVQQQLGFAQLNMAQDPFAQQQQALEIQMQERNRIIQEAGQQRLITQQQQQDLMLQSAQFHAQQMQQVEMARNMQMVSLAKGTFAELANAVGAYAGENSKAYKAMFKVSQAFAIAESIVATQQGVTKALASAPPPMSFIQAGLVAAKGAAATAMIAAQGFNQGTGFVRPKGMHHTDTIPAYLSEGEGIVTARANKANPGLVDAMNRGEAVGGGVTVNIDARGAQDGLIQRLRTTMRQEAEQIAAARVAGTLSTLGRAAG